MILVANAVVDYLAMVVVVFHASLTDCTVTGARRPYAAACEAKVVHISLLFERPIEQLSKVLLLLALGEARITTCRE